MKNAHTISRRGWFVLAMSALLCAGTWSLRQWLRPVEWTGDTELAALVAEREQLRDSDDQTRDALRRQAATRRQDAWTTERIAAFRDAIIGSGWRCEEQPAAPEEYRVRISRTTLRLDGWPACVAFARQWARESGVILESLEITAGGVAQQRRFSRVAIVLRFMLEVASNRNAEQAAPSRGQLPVAPAERAARTRKVGAFTSLRRPAASAKPAASGPASAPFRSDPPGAGAAAVHLSPKHQYNHGHAYLAAS